MVEAVRSGRSAREVAREFRVSHATVRMWVERASRQRLDRVQWENRPSGAREAWNRTPRELEATVLRVRQELRETSALGEYGAAAIAAVLRERGEGNRPALRTLGRILARHGAVERTMRQRWPAPPRGWYLTDVGARLAELESFDVVEDLKIKDGPLLHVLTGASLHGHLVSAWPEPRINAKCITAKLLEHWQEHGLPAYAQFDNDTRFQGAHHCRDTFGRVTRLCLALGVVPVFVPPRETGFQAAIENFNGQWQSKVWQRFCFESVRAVRRQSARYIEAHRQRTAARRESGPERRRWPSGFEFDVQAPLRGQIVYLRRSNGVGAVELLGRAFAVSREWLGRLVRCEVDLDQSCVRFYGLRRRDPDAHVLLREATYKPRPRRFAGE